MFSSRLALRLSKAAGSALARPTAASRMSIAAVRSFGDDSYGNNNNDRGDRFGNQQMDGGRRDGGDGQGTSFRNIKFGRQSPQTPNREFGPSKILYFGNLDYNCSPEDLQAFADSVSPSLTCKLMYDARGLPRGHGFVEYADVESAKRVRETLHSAQFMGRRVNVNFAQPKAEKPAVPASNCLYIGNLAYEIQDADLIEIFKDVKNCLDVRVAMDRRTGQPRGFAHAEFVDINSAKQALEKLQKVIVYGRRLRIDYAQPREMKDAQKTADDMGGSNLAAEAAAESVEGEQQQQQYEEAPQQEGEQRQ